MHKPLAFHKEKIFAKTILKVIEYSNYRILANNGIENLKMSKINSVWSAKLLKNIGEIDDLREIELIAGVDKQKWVKNIER